MRRFGEFEAVDVGSNGWTDGFLQSRSLKFFGIVSKKNPRKRQIFDKCRLQPIKWDKKGCLLGLCTLSPQ